MDSPDPMCLGMCLELVQDPAAHSKAARRFDYPHTLQLGGLFSVELQRAAADRLLVERGDEEETGGRAHLFVVGGDALGGIEAVFESEVQLAEIGAQAKLGVGVARIDWRDF